MQTRQHETVPASAPSSPQPCGCDPSPEHCCGLDTLIQPRFFCGQLLTDQDLTDLVDWTRDKLRLGRHRHGWGVVCGLDVRCDPDPRASGGVVITPGYAVSCCGDDIVVAEDYRFDLTEACRAEQERCADLAGPDPEPQPVQRVIDLYLRYREEDSDPQISLARGACQEAGKCEPSRTRETFTPDWRPAPSGSDPATAAATDWERGYQRCLQVLTEFQAKFPDVAAADPDRIRAWLLERLHKYPPRQLCQLSDGVKALADAELKNEGTLSKLLFQLVQECRGAYLTCACPGCAGGPGVPLARVWLRVDPEDRRCHVETVDADPPFRRPLQTDCWPAPPGSVNAGQVLWHRWPQACTTLADLGVEVAGTVEFTVPATLDQLGEALDCSPFLACGRPAVAQLYDAGRLGRRVVGFCGGAVTPSLALRVAKSAQVASASPGELVPYLVDVANTGDAALRVQLNDDQVGAVGETRLVPGESHRFRYSFKLPDDAAGTLDNTVTVTGSAADGRSVTERASHSLPVAALPTPVGISLTKTADPSPADPGTVVTYRFMVVNSSADAALTVDVRDDQLGEVATGQPIASGQSQTFEKTWQVPEEAAGDITNVATATGTTGDGRTTSSTASFTLAVAAVLSELGLRVVKRGQGFAEPGSRVPYEVEVANAGQAPLTVDVDDDVLGQLATGQDLPAGQSVTFEKTLDVTEQTPAELVNVVTATGVAADGRRVVATSSHVLGVFGGLTEIAGIASGRAETLRNAGIASIADLAAATTERLREVFPRVGERTLQGWIDDARERLQQ